MPPRKTHEEFDRYLADRGVLIPYSQFEKSKYKTVHVFMDRGVYTYGPEHREHDIYHREKGLRSWLNGQINVIEQDLATDWLRVGLGHICLDEAESSLDPKYSLEEVFDSAYRSMAQRGWTKKYFVAR